MGKKTVRWKDLKIMPGHFSCKCDCTGYYEEYDRIYDSTTRYYCDCWYGKQEKEKANVRTSRD